MARTVPIGWILLSTSMAFAGDFTSRYELTLRRVVNGGPPAYSDALILRDVTAEPGRRFTEYSGDVSGRFIGALAMAALDRREAYDVLDRIVLETVSLQKPDGHFGATLPRDRISHEFMAMLWGNGRMLIGLMEYHRYRPNPRILEAARQLGDYLVAIAPMMNTQETETKVREGFAAGYICWTHNIEGLVELHRITKDGRYLTLADQIAERTSRFPGQHSHGFLSSVRGILDLYDVTGRQSHLAKAEREWRGVVDSGNRLVQGAIPEAFHPKMERTEGCSEADWLRLSLALWRVTGKGVYLAEAERTLFNEFSMNQFSSGDFGHRPISSTGIRVGAGKEGSGSARAWWCCTLHGLRCFPDVARSVFRASAAGIHYDLPIDGAMNQDALSLRAESQLGKDGTVAITVTSAAGKSADLLIRRPDWSSGIDLRVNGVNISPLAENGYLRISRTWKTGDVLAVNYKMQTRTERGEKGRSAVFHGPWLLAADDEASPFFWDEPHQQNVVRLPAAASGGNIALVRAPSLPAQAFAVPEARFSVEYLPGGYPMIPSRAVLRPVAEQTGTRSLNWEFWFRLQ
jgi:DUF1680 family protein